MPDPLQRIDVSKLDPAFLVKLRAFCDACQAHGLDIRATSGFRSSGLQAILYKKFLAGGPRAARPGSSKHEKGLAVDFLIFAGGKPLENLDGADEAVYEEMHTIAERYGLKGLDPKLHDAGHIEAQ